MNKKSVMKTGRSSKARQGDENWASRLLKFIWGKCNFTQDRQMERKI